MTAIVIEGMHGLGDNVQQRALVRLLLADGHSLWLRTPWPCLYHDLTGDRLTLLARRTILRTQRKNAHRERERYSAAEPPTTARAIRIWYDYETIRRTGSFLGGMLELTLGRGTEGADIRLPVPEAWRAKAAALVPPQQKPILVLRPLVTRTEWVGCEARNPDPFAYAALYDRIRAAFHVVSIADLMHDVEWLAGPPMPADQTFHQGELDIEAVAGLMARAALVFCSPGFAIHLAQAIGTPVIGIFGGHESSRFYEIGGRFAPTLGIDPAQPCECFSKRHRCNKDINISVAAARIERFIATHCCRHAADDSASAA
jgi:ADP-heptose:LPS heptosyltransferase